MNTDPDDTPSVETLIKEIFGDIDRSALLEAFPDRPEGALFTHKQDPVRLATLVAAATTDPYIPSGKALRDEVSTVFESPASPGTIYPILHDLDDAGLLVRHDRHTSQVAYGIADVEAVDDALAAYEAELEWYLKAVRTARESLETKTE